MAAGSMFVLWLGEKLQIKELETVFHHYHDWYYRPFAVAFFAELTSRVSQQGGGLRWHS